MKGQSTKEKEQRIISQLVFPCCDVTGEITPFIWFEKNVEEAARFYVSIFGKRSGIISSTKLKGAPSGPNTCTIVVKLNGAYFTFLNGGKVKGHKLGDSGAVSFVINCKSQGSWTISGTALQREENQSSAAG